MNASAIGRLRAGIPTAFFSEYSKLPNGDDIPQSIIDHAQSTAVMLAKLEKVCKTRQESMCEYITQNLQSHSHFNPL